MTPQGANAPLAAAIRDLVARGVTVEESRARRRAWLRTQIGGTLVGLAAVCLLFYGLEGRTDALWPAGLVAAVVLMPRVVAYFTSLGPRASREATAQEVAFLASMHRLCGCGAVVGRYGLGCGACGRLRHPKRALAGVILLAVATCGFLAWAWVHTGRP